MDESNDSQNYARDEYPFHTEKSDDETWSDRSDSEGETVDGPDLTICFCPLISWKEKCDERSHGDISYISDDTSCHESQNETPESYGRDISPCTAMRKIYHRSEWIGYKWPYTGYEHDIFLCMMIDKCSEKKRRKHICYRKNTRNPRSNEDWSRFEKRPIGQCEPDKSIGRARYEIVSQEMMENGVGIFLHEGDYMDFLFLCTQYLLWYFWWQNTQTRREKWNFSLYDKNSFLYFVRMIFILLFCPRWIQIFLGFGLLWCPMLQRV